MTRQDPAAALKALIKKVLDLEIDADEFCEQFERLYNFEVDKHALSDQEKRVYDALFDKVVYYSPFADEVDAVPNYVGDNEIMECVAAAYDELGR